MQHNNEYTKRSPNLQPSTIGPLSSKQTISQSHKQIHATKAKSVAEPPTPQGGQLPTLISLMYLYLLIGLEKIKYIKY